MEIVTCDLRNCVYGFIQAENANETRVTHSCASHLRNLRLDGDIFSDTQFHVFFKTEHLRIFWDFDEGEIQSAIFQ